MKLIFQGHDYRYAVEQSLLAFFPAERPVYDGEDLHTARVTLAVENGAARSDTAITVENRTGCGTASVEVPPGADDFARERLCQRAVKLSFFAAARDLTGRTPAWGALTGIRPAKVAVSLLREGYTAEEADNLLRDTYCVSPSRRRLSLECAQAELRADEGRTDRDVSLYLGIPFCPSRCAYCSFVSNSVEKSMKLIEPYLEVLHREIRTAGELTRRLDLRLRTFYMGGGTPTTLTAGQMDALLTLLEEEFHLSALEECTVEAGRPDTITQEKLRVLRDHGIRRISVNPQTMEDDVLRAVGRRHTAADVERTMAQAAAAGFPHINMDLIAGLPGDSPAGFARSLERVMAFGTDHVTVHTLSLKKGSRISLEGTRLPSEEAVGEMLSHAETALRAGGYAPYYLYRQKYQSGSFENVGWCRDGGECRYNIYMMEELHSILSLGAGGTTKLVDRGQNRIERVFQLKYPLEYIQRPEKIIENQRAFEAFCREHFPRQTGEDGTGKIILRER